jgi:hypothetical protein
MACICESRIDSRQSLWTIDTMDLARRALKTVRETGGDSRGPPAPRGALEMSRKAGEALGSWP